MIEARVRSGLVRLLALLAFLAAWEGFVVVRGIRAYLLPPPSAVLARVVRDLPLLLEHTRVTATEAFGGLVLAVLVGVLLATAAAVWPAVRAVIMPAMVGFNSVPKVVLAPLIIIWLGIGPSSKIATAFMLAVFPILVNVASGLRDVDPELLSLVRLMRGSRSQELLKVRLPHALPALFDGLRIALPLAVIGAIVAEFIAARAGLGYLMILSNSRLDTELTFAAIVMVVVFSVAVHAILGMGERRLLHWLPEAR